MGTSNIRGTMFRSRSAKSIAAPLKQHSSIITKQAHDLWRATEYIERYCPTPPSDSHSFLICMRVRVRGEEEGGVLLG
jgi:hypothetical protein